MSVYRANPPYALGLMFYNARWYDPYLNQFLTPDSIVPDPYNPIDYDRYTYVRNNRIISKSRGKCRINWAIPKMEKIG